MLQSRSIVLHLKGARIAARSKSSFEAMAMEAVTWIKDYSATMARERWLGRERELELWSRIIVGFMRLVRYFQPIDPSVSVFNKAMVSHQSQPNRNVL
jgi:hypothetical protein